MWSPDRFPGFIYNDSPNDGDSVSGTTYRFHGVRFTPQRQATAVRVQYRLQNVDGAGYARVIFQEVRPSVVCDVEIDAYVRVCPC